MIFRLDLFYSFRRFYAYGWRPLVTQSLCQQFERYFHPFISTLKKLGVFLIKSSVILSNRLPVFSAGNNLPKVKNNNTRLLSRFRSKFTRQTPERCYLCLFWRFELDQHACLLFPLLALSKYFPMAMLNTNSLCPQYQRKDCLSNNEQLI